MFSIGAVVLAAGKGSRMKSKDINKVALHIANKPMIVRTVELLEKLKVKKIVIVVGFAKESVIKLFGKNVIFAEQTKRLGTAHAVSVALNKLKKEVDDVLVLNGDDSAFYTKKIIEELIIKHNKTKAAFTFLTIEKENPFGLGRVVRGIDGKVKAIVEEKDASKNQKLITEVNPGCYIFKIDFLKRYLKLVKKSPVTGEYYLTSLIGMGIENKENIETLPAGNLIWRGVNTQEELNQAQLLINSK